MLITFSKNTPKYVRDFTYFAARELGLDVLRGDVEFKYCQGSIQEESFGLCWGDNREAELHIATRQFGASINRENKLKTVAHELTHARQYLKRELVAADADVEKPVAVWCGKEVQYEYADEHNQPWEVEARVLEEKIYLKWENKRYK